MIYVQEFWKATAEKRQEIREAVIRCERLVEWELCYKEFANGKIILFFDRGTSNPVPNQKRFNFQLDNILYDELEQGYFLSVNNSQGQFIPKLNLK